MDGAATKERTLSRNESRVVLELEWRDQRDVSLADVRELLACSPGYARFLAHQLVRKGWLERLRRGRFRLIPAERGREAVADTHPLAAGRVLVDPYYFSFGSACTHFGLTEQVFAEVYIACQARRQPETVRDTRYVFVHVPNHRFFGFADTMVLGEQVRMATLERALIDSLDRPHYAGGIGEVSRIVLRAANKISWDDMVPLLQQWEESAVVQRLGYFLDLHRVEVEPDVRSRLEMLVRPNSKIMLGARGKWGASGKLAQPWNVIANVPAAVLVERVEKSKRRVTFNREGS